MKKKLLSILLSLALTVGILPGAALNAGAEGETEAIAPAAQMQTSVEGADPLSGESAETDVPGTDTPESGSIVNVILRLKALDENGIAFEDVDALDGLLNGTDWVGTYHNPYDPEIPNPVFEYFSVVVGENIITDWDFCPDGYVKPDDVIFTCDAEGNITVTSGNAAVEKDGEVTVIVIQLEKDGNEYLSLPLRLKALDENGDAFENSNVLDGLLNDVHWVGTYSNPYNPEIPDPEFEYFSVVVGENIITGWDFCPDGYVKPDDVIFTCDADGNITVTSGNATIEKDGDVTVFVIQLEKESDETDAPETGVNLDAFPLALKALDENGVEFEDVYALDAKLNYDSSKDVYSGWVGTYSDVDGCFELNEGENTLTGWDYCPEGYLKPDDVTFTCDAEGNITVTSGNATVEKANGYTYIVIQLAIDTNFSKMRLRLKVLDENGAAFEDIYALHGMLNGTNWVGTYSNPYDPENPNPEFEYFSVVVGENIITDWDYYPEGYAKPDDLIFNCDAEGNIIVTSGNATIEKDGDVTVFVIQLEKESDETDAPETGVNLDSFPLALKALDENGVEFEDVYALDAKLNYDSSQDESSGWVGTYSDDEDSYYELNEGENTLSGWDYCPEGYLKPDDVTFTCDAEWNITITSGNATVEKGEVYTYIVIQLEKENGESTDPDTSVYYVINRDNETLSDGDRVAAHDVLTITPGYGYFKWEVDGEVKSALGRYATQEEDNMIVLYVWDNYDDWFAFNKGTAVYTLTLYVGEPGSGGEDPEDTLVITLKMNAYNEDGDRLNSFEGGDLGGKLNGTADIGTFSGAEGFTSSFTVNIGENTIDGWTLIPEGYIPPAPITFTVDENGAVTLTSGDAVIVDMDDFYIIQVTLSPMLAFVDSGECTNTIWAFYSDGSLVITGGGCMDNYDHSVTLPTAAPWAKYRNEVTRVEIGPGVTSVGDFSFYKMINLEEVLFHEGSAIEYIGEAAFGYTDIKEITIPAEDIEIAAKAFYFCDSLTTVDFEEGSAIAFIGNYAFRNCGSLERIVLPETIGYMGTNILYACPNVTAHVAQGSYAHKYAEYYGYTYETAESESYLATGICGVGLTWTLSNTGVLTVTGSGAMDDFNFSTLAADAAPWAKMREDVTKIVIGKDVTSIGTYAFYRMQNLTEVEFEEDSALTTIGLGAFGYTASLKNITLPDALESIGKNGFYFSGLEDITFGSGLTTIGHYAFRDTALAAVALPSGLTDIGAKIFYNTDPVMYVVKDSFLHRYAELWGYETAFVN